MKRSPTILLLVCGAGAQMSWHYGWTSFLLFSFFQRVYPLPQAVGIFSLAALLAVFCRRRCRRPIQIAAIHLAGITAAALWVVHVVYYRPQPWWRSAWLIDFFDRPRNQMEWFLLIFVLVYTVFFWFAGVRFAQEEKSYTRACSRFDRGLIAFFCIFLVKLTLHSRMGVEFRDAVAFLMIFPFFVFSLTEIGLACGQGSERRKEYLSGYYTVGVLASFACGAVIIASAIFLFFLPYLKAASAAGYDLWQGAAGPLGAVAAAVLKFIFGHADWDRSIAEFPVQLENANPGQPGPWIQAVQAVVMWGGAILLAAIGAVTAGVLIWFGLRWLFRNQAAAVQIEGQWRLLTWWTRIKDFANACCRWILGAGRKRTALEFYRALARWGRYGGLPLKSNETPMEYGRRLSRHFPRLSAEITLIIEMLQREVYGEIALYAQEITRVRRAWKKLRSPLVWPYRVKSAMHHSDQRY